MNDLEKAKKEFLDLVMTKGALRIADNMNNMFELKSGRKSPHFVNLRMLTDGESLKSINNVYSSFIQSLVNEGKIEDFDFIFGPAYAGINLACLACEGLYEKGMNKKYLYDRKEVKNYADKDMDKFIVGAGHFKNGNKILLIDDVITTGETKLKAIEKLKVLGDHKIVGMILAVDRQEKMGDSDNVEEISAIEKIEKELGIKTFSILTIEDIFNTVKDDLPLDVKQAWIDYYDKYGTVKLSH